MGEGGSKPGSRRSPNSPRDEEMGTQPGGWTAKEMNIPVDEKRMIEIGAEEYKENR